MEKLEKCSQMTKEIRDLNSPSKREKMNLSSNRIDVHRKNETSDPKPSTNNSILIRRASAKDQQPLTLSFARLQSHTPTPHDMTTSSYSRTSLNKESINASVVIDQQTRSQDKAFRGPIFDKFYMQRKHTSPVTGTKEKLKAGNPPINQSIVDFYQTKNHDLMAEWTSGI